jgi:hypothetical protein
MGNLNEMANKDFAKYGSDEFGDAINYYDIQAYEIPPKLYRNPFPLILIIASTVIIILVILSIYVISKSQDFAGERQIRTIEERLDQLETDLNSLGQAIKKLESNNQTTVKPKEPPSEIQLPPPQKPKDLKPMVHQVQAGDSLYRISQHYGLSVEQLRDYNQLAPGATIFPGQELRLSP